MLGRAPRPGQAKTRLIPALGPRGAARAHARLLTHVAGVTRAWCAAGPGRLFRLWCTPDLRHPLFRTLARPEELRVQSHGDLGRRLARVAEEGLVESRAVFLVGGDCVSLTASLLDEALAMLERHPAVLAPAADGGYVLLGLTRLAKALFRDMPWGGPEVAAVTRERLRSLGWSWGELPVQWDVDGPDDWARFLRNVSRATDSERAIPRETGGHDTEQDIDFSG
ncbi:MAG: TIGR04282 family arsenosugar biosynthesis glycosyltransferase [Magnetococcales bacterium]|nr:TIGR04282 family arsenosugar biosynthesis glycosyltransferase [Magnetococcales bacterium]